jgi:PilZ domain
MSEKREFPRLELSSTVLITTHRRAWLAHVQDISGGGARVQKPLDWQTPGYTPLTLYFIFDQDTVVCMRAALVRDAPDHLGFWFKSGQDEELGRLLYESRFATG